MTNWKFATITLLLSVALPGELPAQTELAGRVLDKQTKKPVTEFQLRKFGAGSGELRAQPEELSSETVKDRKGAFKIALPVAGPVVVSAPGYLPGVVEVPSGAAAKPKPVEVALERGVPLRGTVTAQDGTALAGVEVTYDLRAPGLTGLKEKVLTDEKGGYTATLEAGEKTFAFTKEGFVAEQQHYRVPEKEARLDVTLYRVTRTSGVIKDDTGAPIPGARVRALWKKRAGEAKEAKTDDQGAFALTMLRSGSYQFEVTKRGYAARTVDAVELPASEPLTIQVDRGSTVTGKVDGATEEERPYVMVYVGTVITGINQEGKFGVLGIAPGKTATYAEVASPGSLRRTDAKQLTVGNGGEVQVKLRFATEPVLKGQVLEKEAPVERAVVVVTPAWPSILPPARVVTDETGSYQVVGMPPGSYTIEVEGREMLGEKTHRVSETVSTFDIPVGPRKRPDSLLPRGTAEASAPSKP